ncbi:MAG: hypothetical protein MK085_01175 [Phycisphaerales bacterium]|nr:hypothetical protein [Phycisphaerales bacterium]
MPRFARVIGTLARGTLAVAVLTGPAAVANNHDRNSDQSATPPTRKVEITGDRLGGLVLPIEPIKSNLVLGGERCWHWVVDDTQRVFLKGGVSIELGSYAFAASEAVVWINRLPSDRGLVNQVAIWFPNVSEPTRRAGLGASGRDVLVTASLLGEIRLSTVIMEEKPPFNLTTVRRGEERLSRFLGTLVVEPLPRLATLPKVEVPPRPPKPILEPGGALDVPPTPETAPPPATMDLPVRTGTALPIFAPQGMVSFSGNDVTIDEARDVITVVGQVQIDYDSNGANDRFERISLASQRGVVFLVPGTLRELREGVAQVTADSITGIYLEGGVRATDGEYTLRGSSVYYDLQSNKALVLDAILRTYTRIGRELPIYARAREMQQLSADQWTASKATVSTSEFFEPHISIGMNRVTITEQPEPEGGRSTWVQGDGLTFRAQGIPFFFWPGFAGEAETSPLQTIRTGWQRDKGFVLGTTWDAFALLGLESPGWASANLRVDGFSERGPALGLDLELSRLGGIPGNGYFDIYGLYDLGGTDRTAGGRNVDVDQGLRGQVVGQYQANLSVDLLLQAQLAYLSDQTWAAAWRRTDYNSRREYESSLYMAYSPDNTLLSGLVKGNANSFLSNGWKIANQPYFVEKVPEFEYNRVGDDLFKTLTWSSDYSFSRMAIKPTSGSAESLGVKQSNFATGSQVVDVKTLYEDAGYNSKDVMRFHTRQELAIPFKGQSWNVTPFVFGRFTYYMDGDWKKYRELQGVETDQDNYRYMLGGGARASTRFERVHNEAQSDLFDINRIRHIIEPNMTLFYGWDSAPNGSYPIYDQAIEGATGGTAAQVGLRQIFQTQRGGPGNWTSVDFLEIDIGAVFNDAADNFQRTDVITPNPIPGAADPTRYNPYAWVQSPYPQFYNYEPELSQWGTHGYGTVTWQLSSSFTLGGTGLFSWNDREVIDFGTTPQVRTISGLLRGSIGAQMTHNPDTRSYIEYRYLGASEDEILQAGVMYRIGRKYEVALSPQYDLRRGEFRAFGGSLRRTFPDFVMNLRFSYGLITDETTVGLSLSIPRQAQQGQGFSTY